jgi:uncharacterized OsmC-like protein
MGLQHVADAMARAVEVLKRRPSMGLHGDAPAIAHWQGGAQIVTRHANGTEVVTDLAKELGGSGQHVTPGWLLRAGLASCGATSIAMVAAEQNIELRALELHASSRSDARGLLGVEAANGAPISAGPQDVELRVRISANGASPERLRTLVETALGRSPVPAAMREPVAIQLRIEVGDP